MSETTQTQPAAVDTLAEAVQAAVVHKFTLGTSMGEHHEAWHRFAVSIADKVMSLVSPEIARLERDLAEARQQIAALEVQLPGVREDADQARRSPGSRQCPDVEPHTDHVWDATTAYLWCPGTT